MSSECSPGCWKVLLVNPKRMGSNTVAGTGEIEPGDCKEVVVDVEIGNRRLGRAIECQVVYNGEGQLEMHHVEVKRIK